MVLPSLELGLTVANATNEMALYSWPRPEDKETKREDGLILHSFLHFSGEGRAYRHAHKEQSRVPHWDHCREYVNLPLPLADAIQYIKNYLGKTVEL